MELTELYNTAVKHNFNKPFACKWSKDDKISILTDNGIHILKFQPDMKRLNNNFSSSFFYIKPTEETPATYTDIDIDKFISTWNHKKLYYLINDVALTPKISNMEYEKATFNFIQIVWSPILTPCQSCISATLTNMGFVEVHIIKESTVKVLFCLTELWIKHLKTLWKDFEIDKEFEEHENRIQQIQTVCIEWSSLYSNNLISFIIMAHRNGDLSIWKYSPVSDNKLQSVSLVYEHQTHLYRISSLHWIKISEDSGYLIIGNNNGMIKLLTFNNLRSDKITCTSETLLWSENDNITVSYITTQNWGNEHCVLAVKGMFIICFVISNSNKLICSKCYNVGNIYITGLQEICIYRYTLTCISGYICCMELNRTSTGVEIKLAPLKSNLKWDHVSPTGICCSHNKALWIISTMYTKEIDHLIIRAPTQIFVCANSIDVESIIINNPTQRLTDYWDCIEVLRLLMDKSNEPDSKCIGKLQNYSNVSLYNMKIYMWMSYVCEAYAKRKKCPSKIEEITSSVDMNILFRGKYAMERMKLLIEKYESGIELNEKQLKSVHYLRNFIINFKESESFKEFLGENTLKTVNSLLQRSSKIPTGDLENCLLCGEKIITTTCSHGHENERCVISFSLIDESYLICPYCESAADPLIEEQPLCTFCDILMIPCVFD